MVFAHGFLSVEGEKMSKTRGTMIEPTEVLEKYNADVLRYYLMREVPFNGDGDFSWARLEQRYNADLANDFGNLVNRSLSMIGRYRQGTVPKAGNPDALDGDLRTTAEKVAASYQQRMNELDTGGALTDLWQLVTRANRYVEESAPWKLAKEPAQASELDSVLYNLAESVRFDFGAGDAVPANDRRGRCASNLVLRINWTGSPKKSGGDYLQRAQRSGRWRRCSRNTHDLFSESSRFHVIDESKVLPRFGHLAHRPIYVYLPELAEHDHRRRFPVLYCHDGQNIWDDPRLLFRSRRLVPEPNSRSVGAQRRNRTLHPGRHSEYARAVS